MEVSAIKLLTLNTHSLVESNYNKKLETFIDVIEREKPDIIALQEVNQTCDEKAVEHSLLHGFCPCGKGMEFGKNTIKKDNHAYNVVKELRDRGINYYWTWIGMKKGYNKYDEGIAILSLSEIIDTDQILISNINDYNNWKTRRITGVRTKAMPDTWFYSVHMGWWNDSEEPFHKQWEMLDAHMKKYMQNGMAVWLMGDFNSPSDVRDEGYDMVIKSGWIDSYSLANTKDSGITVSESIDGWKDNKDSRNGMRIDYIWCSEKSNVKSSQVIFNGINDAVVSDHYGVIIETE